MNNSGTFKALGELPDDLIDDFKNKRYDICIKKCNEIIVSNPNNGIAYIYLGKISESKKDYESAIKYFTRVTEIEPGFNFGWKFLGENYMYKEKYEEALDAFKKEIGLTPFEASPWCMSALVAQKMEKNDLARGILKLAQERVSEEGQSIVAFSIGALEELAGNKDEALINYLQSQITAKDGEGKEISTKRIYKMLK